jgi:hypothetical protein
MITWCYQIKSCYWFFGSDQSEVSDYTTLSDNLLSYFSFLENFPHTLVLTLLAIAHSTVSQWQLKNCSSNIQYILVIYVIGFTMFLSAQACSRMYTVLYVVRFHITLNCTSTLYTEFYSGNLYVYSFTELYPFSFPVACHIWYIKYLGVWLKRQPYEILQIFFFRANNTLGLYALTGETFFSIRLRNSIFELSMRYADVTTSSYKA